MAAGDEALLRFIREPVTEPAPETLYVAVVLTIEERRRILRGLSYARSRIREIMRNVALTPAERSQFQEQVRELDRVSSELYTFPAYNTRDKALDAAR